MHIKMVANFRATGTPCSPKFGQEQPLHVPITPYFLRSWLDDLYQIRVTMHKMHKYQQQRCNVLAFKRSN